MAKYGNSAACFQKESFLAYLMTFVMQIKGIARIPLACWNLPGLFLPFHTRLTQWFLNHNTYIAFDLYLTANNHKHLS